MASNITIAQIISDEIPETERLLNRDMHKDDGTLYEDLKARAIAMVKAEFGVENVAESGLPILVRQFLARKCLADTILNAAINYYMDKTRMRVNTDGSTLQFNDRARILQHRLLVLRQWITNERARVEALIGGDDHSISDYVGVSSAEPDYLQHTATGLPDPFIGIGGPRRW